MLKKEIRDNGQLEEMARKIHGNDPTMSSVVRARSASRIDFSRYCVISIWFGCNNRCPICMLGNFRNRLPGIGFERYHQAILSVRQNRRYDNLILSGGEVTTFDLLGRYVRDAASLGWFEKIQIQTNGRRLGDSAYLDQLIDSGVNEFFVSIHGFEAAHDAAVGVAGAFRETSAGLRNLSERRVNVISNTVLTRENVAGLPDFVRAIGQTCVSEIHLWNYFPMAPVDRRNLLVPLGDLLRVMPKLRKIAQDTGKVVVLKSFPLCLPAEPPVYLDSIFPQTVLPDLFWQEFDRCGFGQCVHREAGLCGTKECWGLCSAYIDKYGDERSLLKPIMAPRF
jgi:MoaA/NifB/PqqE/SkfB family radical SAM enzyme